MTSVQFTTEDGPALVLSGEGAKPAVVEIVSARARVSVSATGRGKTWRAVVPLAAARWGGPVLPLPAGDYAVGAKWPVLIVTLLSERPRRFSELKRAVGGISQKSLTATLRELERDGLVARAVTPVIPPRVDYALTPLGASLLPPLAALTDWAVANERAVAAARARFDPA